MRVTSLEIYAEILKDRSGLIVKEDKAYLLESRLKPVAAKWDYPTVEAMSFALQGVSNEDLVTDVVEAMTTNETFFFRDNRPFDIFKDTVLPFVEQNRPTKRLRIWCCAASSGQEPYSLAMILKDNPAFKNWNIEIFATDISKDIIEVAKTGIYTQFEVQRGLPINMLMSHFTQLDDGKWKISDNIISMVKFDTFNLLDSPSMFGTFDVIYCRNVLIYFAPETKTEIFGKLSKVVSKDGFLFLGGAETTIGLTENFIPIPNQRGVYGPPEHPLAAK